MQISQLFNSLGLNRNSKNVMDRVVKPCLLTILGVFQLDVPGSVSIFKILGNKTLRYIQVCAPFVMVVETKI